MSADKGIYILRTNKPPLKEGGFYVNQHDQYEYRVAECQAIDNIEYSDLYLPILFGRSKVYSDKDSAWQEARRMYDDIMNSGFPILEYGISSIIKDKPFPNITPDAAAKALDCFVGAKPLDYHGYSSTLLLGVIQELLETAELNQDSLEEDTAMTVATARSVVDEYMKTQIGRAFVEKPELLDELKERLENEETEDWNEQQS